MTSNEHERGIEAVAAKLRSPSTFPGETATKVARELIEAYIDAGSFGAVHRMTSNEQRGLDAATNVLLLKAHKLSARELAESAIAAYLEATAPHKAGDALTRPIIGIENRTAQEVFGIMCDRVRLAGTPPPSPQMLGDGEAAIIECLAAGKPFVFDPATNFLHADDGTVEYGIRYVPDDRQPAPDDQLRVTPLVWRTLDNGTAWSNRTPVGLMYHATEYGWQYRNGDINPTAGIEAAKAAAQSDYEACILSCLSTATPEKQP